MMGVGKTTVGELLAARLGCAYLDSDEQVERNTGRTVPEIFAGDGEAAFRAEEKRALGAAASFEMPVVVAVAGGAVLDADNRRVIKDAGFVVWLRASLATMVARVGDGSGRPLLGGDPAAVIARLYPERRSLYEELADLVIDVDEASPDAIVETVVNGFHRYAASTVHNEASR